MSSPHILQRRLGTPHARADPCIPTSSLTHIVSNYDVAATAPGRTATHVLFAQSILEYPELVSARLAVFRKDTRFLSLGQYRACGCGRYGHIHNHELDALLTELRTYVQGQRPRLSSHA